MTGAEHAMIGALGSFLGPNQRWGWRGTVMTMVAALAPDVDAACWLFTDWEGYFYIHRAVTHGIPGVLAVALVLACFWRWVVGLRGFGTVLGWNVVFAATNPLADMLYGKPDVRFFWPFSDWGWSVEVLRFGDLIPLVLLIVPCVWIWRRPRLGPRVAPAFLGALVVYLLIRVFVPEPGGTVWQAVTGGWMQWVYDQIGVVLPS